MTSFTNFIIIPDKKLIIEYFSGKIDLENLLELKYRESVNKDYNQNYNTIYDSRNAEFLVDEKKILAYVNHIRNNKLINGKRKAACLTKTPNQVVIASLFDLLKQELSIDVKIVSTINAALEWVGIFPYDKVIIEQYLNELRIIR